MIPPRRWASGGLSRPMTHGESRSFAHRLKPAAEQKQERGRGGRFGGASRRRGKKEQQCLPALGLGPSQDHLVTLRLPGLGMFGIPQWPRWTRNGSQPTQRASEGSGAVGSPSAGLAGFHGPGCLDDLQRIPALWAPC